MNLGVRLPLKSKVDELPFGVVGGAQDQVVGEALGPGVRHDQSHAPRHDLVHRLQAVGLDDQRIIDLHLRRRSDHLAHLFEKLVRFGFPHVDELLNPAEAVRVGDALTPAAARPIMRFSTVPPRTAARDGDAGRPAL